MKTAVVPLAFIITASLVGCVLNVGTHDSENIQSGISNNADADAGNDAEPIKYVDAQSDIGQCKVDCDCYDNNVCTQDLCVDGVCHFNTLEGGCGSTVGTCRGNWCCTSETTCFQAYDNEGLCRPDAG